MKGIQNEITWVDPMLNHKIGAVFNVRNLGIVTCDFASKQMISFNEHVGTANQGRASSFPSLLAAPVYLKPKATPGWRVESV